MSSGYKIREGEAAYYLTFQIVGWVDIFTRKIYRDIVIESFKYCQQNKDLQLFAYVIMSNHIHILARSETGNLSGIVRDFKNYKSKKILAFIQEGAESRSDWMKTYQVWSHENHAEEIYSQKFIGQKINYIHNNPVRSGIVEKP